MNMCSGKDDSKHQKKPMVSNIFNRARGGEVGRRVDEADSPSRETLKYNKC